MKQVEGWKAHHRPKRELKQKVKEPFLGSSGARFAVRERSRQTSAPRVEGGRRRGSLASAQGDKRRDGEPHIVRKEEEEDESRGR